MCYCLEVNDRVLVWAGLFADPTCVYTNWGGGYVYELIQHMVLAFEACIRDTACFCMVHHTIQGEGKRQESFSTLSVAGIKGTDVLY